MLNFDWVRLLVTGNAGALARIEREAERVLGRGLGYPSSAGEGARVPSNKWFLKPRPMSFRQPVTSDF